MGRRPILSHVLFFAAGGHLTLVVLVYLGPVVLCDVLFGAIVWAVVGVLHVGFMGQRLLWSAIPLSREVLSSAPFAWMVPCPAGHYSIVS